MTIEGLLERFAQDMTVNTEGNPYLSLVNKVLVQVREKLTPPPPHYGHG